MKRYRKEQELMLSALHDVGMPRVRDHLGAVPPKQSGHPGPTSWLAQQRKNVSADIFGALYCNYG